MNVDTFEGNPSLKYYFIVSVSFMLFVIVGWYAVKHLLRFKSQVLPKKGIYESFYNEMSDSSPAFWSRYGPRDYILPKGRVDRVKWKLVRRWAAPERTINREVDKKNDIDPANDLGTMNRFRRYLMRRWTSQLEETARNKKTISLEDGDISNDGKSEHQSVIAEALAEATEVMVIPATPAAETIFDHDAPPQIPPPDGYFSRTTRPVQDILSRKLSSQSVHRRSSSGDRASCVVVEEEDWQWLNEKVKKGKDWALSAEGSRSRSRSAEGKREETKGEEVNEKDDAEKHDDEAGRDAAKDSSKGPERPLTSA